MSLPVSVSHETPDYHQLSLANLKTLAAYLGSANQTVFKYHGGQAIQAIVSQAEDNYRLAFVAARGTSPDWKHVYDLTVEGLSLLHQAEAQALALSQSPTPGS